MVDTSRLLGPILVLLGILYFALYVCLCDEVGETANRLGRKWGRWVVFSFFITPFFAAIFVHCLGKVEKGDDEKRIS